MPAHTLEEQKKNQQVIPSDVNVVTGNTLRPNNAGEFEFPQAMPAFDVEALNAEIEVPKLEATRPELGAQDIVQRLTELSPQLVGESAFRGQQEEQRGIPELLKTQQDLSGQLKMLQAEAKAIPIRLQQEAEGRGITAGGLAPIQRAQLRENAIQALTVSSLLEASRGNLLTAQTLVDRAVAQKFDPIREEIGALRSNLELIQESPDYTRADKNRALQQRFLLDQREQQQEEDRRNYESNLKLANELIERGVQDPRILNAVQNAQIDGRPSLAAAQQIAAQTGVFVEPEVPVERDTQLTEVGGRRVLIDTQTGEVIRDFGVIDVGDGELPETKLTGGQRVAAGYAARLEQSGKIIDELGKQFTGAFGRIGFVPEFLKSEDRKKIEQAERNFVNAVLRRESGAAIAPSEFESAQKQYFPQKGDTEAVLAQKTQNRQVAIESMRLEAGEAFDQLQGALQKNLPQSVKVGGKDVMVGTIIVNSKGQKGVVNDDGTITIIP
jgi:hypothetical protein